MYFLLHTKLNFMFDFLSAVESSIHTQACKNKVRRIYNLRFCDSLLNFKMLFLVPNSCMVSKCFSRRHRAAAAAAAAAATLTAAQVAAAAAVIKKVRK